MMLADLLTDDFDLAKRTSGGASLPDIEAACTYALDRSDAMPIVYTAFDGDHQQLSGAMRSVVLQHGRVPANPESILGYKDTVLAHLEKRGVLLDDLAILRGCDELWVFTDAPCEPIAVQSLAEGVVIELLFYLKRQARPTVKFVPVASLLANEAIQPQDVTFTFRDAEAALLPEQREGVLPLANSRNAVDVHLPSIVYHIFDPLDFKYAEWLREEAYKAGDGGRAPLVPYLAVELQDVTRSPEGLELLLLSWIRLLQLADSAWELPEMDTKRSRSAVAALLERSWIRRKSAPTRIRRAWSDYRIPKARTGNKWPLTRLESGTSWL